MKALTLWEPWASLLAHGHKGIETRCWSTKYRGPIAIHSAKRRPEHLGASCERPEFISKVNELMPAHPFPLGCILGVRVLKDVIPTELAREFITDQERLFGNYEDGRYAWLFDLELLILKKPVPVAGNRMLWNVAEEVLGYEQAV